MADHKEYWSTESDQGSIRISEDVVASIAALAASETDGVSGLYSSVTRDIVSFLSKKNLSKGVRVELGEEDTVKVEISFLALFGHNICEVAKQVQDNVKSQIESMTGLHVVEINVHVGGVTFAPAAEEKVAEPGGKGRRAGGKAGADRREACRGAGGKRGRVNPEKCAVSVGLAARFLCPAHRTRKSHGQYRTRKRRQRSAEILRSRAIMRYCPCVFL